MTSTEETRESMMSEARVLLSRLMAFAFPLMRTVVFLQREMRIVWLISASISTISVGDSKFSTTQRLPSSSFRGGFLVRMDSGLGFLPGGAGLLLLSELLLSLRVGTGADARREGFLCVI